MAIFYTYSTNNYWDGDSIQAGANKGPRRSTTTVPPSLSAGPPQEYAVYIKDTDSWDITTDVEVFPIVEAPPLPIKRISMSDIIITLPIQTKMQLEDVKDIAFGGGSPTAEEIEDGYKADFTLTYHMLGRDININAEKFIEMMDFMVANSVIGVTQEHVDTLVNDIATETRDL